MLAIASLIIILALSITVTKVATIILKHTGLSEQSARFQARSAFTGVGFTTKESETVVNHPVRRKTLMILMLLGNMGIVTSMSSLLIAFVGDNSSSPSWFKIFMIVTGVVAIWTFASSAWVEKYLSLFVERVLKKYTSLEIRDYASLLHLQGNYRILEQAVTKDMWICDKALKEIKLWKEGILLLGIKKADGDFLGAPMIGNTIYEGDELILYGHIDKLEQLAQREYGIAGDFAHKKAALERKKEISELKEEESDSEGPH